MRSGDLRFGLIHEFLPAPVVDAFGRLRRARRRLLFFLRRLGAGVVIHSQRKHKRKRMQKQSSSANTRFHCSPMKLFQNESTTPPCETSGQAESGNRPSARGR
jgi:hypothetical protein